jgi:hypothetical protein
MDILQQYAARPTDTHSDFDEVARQVPPDVLGAGLAHALKSDQTPAFGDLASRLFGNSNGQQRAGLLGQLISAIGPAALSSIAGGALGRLGQVAAAPGQPGVSPADADRVTPEQVREIATEAEKKDPSVMDRVGSLYAQHPDVFKALGGSVLAIALGQMANRMKR